MKNSIITSLAFSLFAFAAGAKIQTNDIVNYHKNTTPVCNIKSDGEELVITQKTYVSKIIKKYGDIADVMELFGVKRVGGFGIRKVLTHIITVRAAAFVHHVPKDQFLLMVQNAVKGKSTITTEPVTPNK